ncbi:MAG: RidA family protein [Bryobacteraceae bacterium]|nr:RidA family protein [Bryobacteraceae bacterium]
MTNQNDREDFQLKDFEAEFGYQQAVRVGNSIYVAGTVSLTNDGIPRDVGDMAAQVRNAYADVVASLAHFGATLSHVVREAIFVTDMELFLKKGLPERLRAYEGHRRPAGAPWVQVPRLAHVDFLFEVEVYAILSE